MKLYSRDHGDLLRLAATIQAIEAEAGDANKALVCRELLAKLRRHVGIGSTDETAALSALRQTGGTGTSRHAAECRLPALEASRT